MRPPKYRKSPPNPDWNAFATVLDNWDCSPTATTIQDKLLELEQTILEAAEITSPTKKYRPLGRPLNYAFLSELKKVATATIYSSPEAAKSKLYGRVARLRERIPDLDRYERTTVHAVIDGILEYFDRAIDGTVLDKRISQLRRLLQTSHLRKQKHRISAKRRRALRAFDQGKLATTIAFYLDKEKGSDPPPTEMIPDIVAFYESVMSNGTPFADEFQERFPRNPHLQEPISPILTSNDFLSGLKKKARTPGPSGLSLLYIQKAPRKIQETYAQLLADTWATRTVPDHLCKKTLVCLPKCENPTPSQYRPITLLEDTRKLLTGTITRKAYKPTTLSPTQHGFRSGYSTDSATAILMHTIQTQAKSKSPLVGATLDISKAFDSIPWSYLPETLARCGISPETTEYILAYEKGGTAMLDDHAVRSSAGVPQGRVMS